MSITWRTLELSRGSISRIDADVTAELRPMEYRLMRMFMEQPVRMYLSDDIMRKVGCTTRKSLTVQICLLNAKLETLGFGLHSDENAYGLYEARKN